MNALVHSRAWLLLGWSMIHFLWVGGAVLIATGVLRLLLQRATPNVRYAVAVATLVILVASPALVAVRLAPRSLADAESASLGVSRALVDVPYQPALATNDANRPTSPSQTVAAAPTEPALDLAAIEAMTRRGGRIGAAYLPWLWLAGFPITAIYLLAGISGTGRLRRRARLATEPSLLATLDRLAAELGMRGRAVIGLSAQIVAPLVVGIARPMILLPPVLLAAWSPEELELILLHELAHVRRWDNLVNLLQRIAEAVLFFHPAVWIVSRWARLEREQCCDEIVLRHRDAPQKYAETLAALAVPGISPVHAAAAMANHQLVARIRNILNVEDRTMRFSARSVLAAAGSLALLAGLLIVAGPLAADNQPTTPTASPLPDNVKAPKSTEKWEKFLVDVDLDGREVGDALRVVKDASGSQAANGQKRPWGPEQACGAPDTSRSGDWPTAWASATPDGQREWLEVDFGESIDGVALVVYETNSGGAIDRLSPLNSQGAVIDSHDVKDPTRKGDPWGISPFPLVQNMQGVRIELDSPNVPGWNEIDAVGLLDSKGQIHWAKTAKASSTYADVGDTAQAGQPTLVFAGGGRILSSLQLDYRPQPVDVAIEQDLAHDPEIMRLRANIQEIELTVRGIAIAGDDNQKDLAKKRIRRAELRKSLLNEELEERAEMLRRERSEAWKKSQLHAKTAEIETQVAAQRALAAEQAARANAAKAEAQLKAAADANRKLQDEIAALQHRDADERVRKAVAEHMNCATCHGGQHEAAGGQTLKEPSKAHTIEKLYEMMSRQQPVVRFDVQALASAKQNLGIVAHKLEGELKELDRQAQDSSNTGRAQIAERMQRLHDEVKVIEATIKELDKSLQDEAARETIRVETQPTKPATPAREDRAALDRIEQLEKAVQELRRGQQVTPPTPSASPGQPR
jgi:beta-lactamase regulating signal transducer with metallopeptidase domain